MLLEYDGEWLDFCPKGSNHPKWGKTHKHTDCRRICCYLRGAHTVLWAHLQPTALMTALWRKRYMLFHVKDGHLLGKGTWNKGLVSGTQTQRGTDGAYLISTILYEAWKGTIWFSKGNFWSEFWFSYPLLIRWPLVIHVSRNSYKKGLLMTILPPSQGNRKVQYKHRRLLSPLPLDVTIYSPTPRFLPHPLRSFLSSCC